jgi:hypothetical protein
MQSLMKVCNLKGRLLILKNWRIRIMRIVDKEKRKEIRFQAKF